INVHKNWIASRSRPGISPVAIILAGSPPFLNTAGIEDFAYAHIIATTEDDVRHGAAAVSLAALRQEFHGPLIANGGFNRDTATRALADGTADAVAFDRFGCVGRLRNLNAARDPVSPPHRLPRGQIPSSPELRHYR